jgi:hypothetical protein
VSEPEPDDLEALTDHVPLASRALVAAAGRSIAGIDDEVTVPQFRVLVVLDGPGAAAADLTARRATIVAGRAAFGDALGEVVGPTVPW